MTDMRDELRKAAALNRERPDWTKSRMPTTTRPHGPDCCEVTDPPAYLDPLHDELDPLHDELDRLRKWQHDVCDQFGYATTPADTAEVLAWIPEFRKKANAEAWCRAAAEVECKQAEARAERAEARVDQLHGNLDMLRATLEEERAFNKQRSDALNRTAASNDQLRAKVARVEKLATNGPHVWSDEVGACVDVDDLREALADQETS